MSYIQDIQDLRFVVAGLFNLAYSCMYLKKKCVLNFSVRQMFDVFIVFYDSRLAVTS